MMPGDRSLFTLPAGVQTRWASPENPAGLPGQGGATNGGRKGKPSLKVAAGEQVVLAKAENVSGIVRRIWATIEDRTPVMLRSLRIDCYWDGAQRPAISAPLGDFFGTGLGRCVPFQSVAFSNPEGRSFNCWLPMPFRRGMRITLTNESPRDVQLLFYDVDFTIGDPVHADMLYLHAHWNRENPTTVQRDYEILPRVKGQGRYLGANLGVVADKRRYFASWWGEGEVKVFLDEESEGATLCGTGTEDYIGTAWGQGRYDHFYQGCQVADADRFAYCFYRYHVADPIYFCTQVRVTIQQIGCWSPDCRWQLSRKTESLPLAAPGAPPVDWANDVREYGLFERQDDWSSCAYFYLDRPDNDLPPLISVAERSRGL